jgi:hypothetical protein
MCCKIQSNKWEKNLVLHIYHGFFSSLAKFWYSGTRATLWVFFSKLAVGSMGMPKTLHTQEEYIWTLIL